jgi:mRNA-decapping enzyme subunit 2
MAAVDSSLSAGEALDDVAMRFLVNLPSSERENLFVERLFFQLQQAHWFYEDFYVDDFDHIPHLGFRDFTRIMFERCDLLKAYRARHADFVDKFKDYAKRIPSFGGIVLDEGMTHVLLVRAFKTKSWGWPKGKVNEGETDMECAAREVLEETGIDVSSRMHAEDFVAYYNGMQLVKLFIASGVSRSVKAAPQVRKEVEEVTWHKLADIPLASGTTGASRFWALRPALRNLHKWIDSHRKTSKRGSKPARAPPPPSSAHKETFGSDASGWSVEDMFRTNAEMLGVEFRYDGNPHTFGEASVMAKPDTAKAPSGKASSGKKRQGGVGNDGLIETFGATSPGWSVEDMFRTNAEMLGLDFQYDGNPHTFGEASVMAKPSRLPPEPAAAEEADVPAEIQSLVSFRPDVKSMLAAFHSKLAPVS